MNRRVASTWALLAFAPCPTQAAPAPAVAVAAEMASAPEPAIGSPFLDAMAPLPGDAMAPLPGDAIAWPTLESVEGTEIVVEAAEADVRYAVNVVGLSAPGLLASFNALSQLYKGRGEPSNIAQIRRRTVVDTALIDQLLRSIGYFDGTITSSIVAPRRSGEPTQVSFNVDPGPLYQFSEINIIAPDPAAVAVATRGLALAVGQVAAAAPFDAAQAGLRPALANDGHPFAEIGEPNVIIDHATRSALLTQAIDPGPLGRFGAVISDGGAQITSRHMQRMVRFSPGDVYSAAEVEDLRRALIATNLFGSVVVRPVNAGTNADGSAIVDLLVTGETAPLRTVSASAGYSTGEGIRVAASWQHRNLFPPQGAVTVNSVVAQRELALGAEFRRRNWLRRDRTLVLSAQLAAQEQDAFDATTATIGGLVELETNLIWQKKWYYSLGLEFAASNEDDLSVPTGIDSPRTLYYILTAPLSLSYDGSNDLLNPERGFRLTLRAAPQVSFQTGSFAYVQALIEGSYYQPVGNRVTLAGRARLGTILGASRGDIAPTRRFYAGGGGSVRGYDFQQVGPKNPEGVPTGGNALTELSLEARIRFGDWGVVPFVDAGQINTGSTPGFNDLSFGVGIGARYFTSFGPIRIDVATPINPGPNDPKVAFYVSIGQAF